jgi:hypothetical protein
MIVHGPSVQSGEGEPQADPDLRSFHGSSVLKIISLARQSSVSGQERSRSLVRFVEMAKENKVLQD